MLTAKEMQVGVQYIVEKQSDDGTFERGDRIKKLEDGAIICIEAKGWIEPSDVDAASSGMTVAVDTGWLSAKKKHLETMLAGLNNTTEKLI